jgi:hypothetical protein
MGRVDQPDPPETAWVVAVAGAWVTVVAAWEVVVLALDEVELAAMLAAAVLAASVPGIVMAPITAKSAVATLAAAAEPSVRRRRRRSPASRLLGVGLATVVLMSHRMSGATEGFLRACLESAVKIWRVLQGRRLRPLGAG